MRISHINIEEIKATNMRIDASYHLSEGQEVKRLISSSPFEILTVGEVCSDIFIGNRARRVYVTKKEKGVPFLSSSDILQADLENVKLASKKYTPSIEQMTLKKGWTLISRSGTIGNCAFANATHAQKLASEHVIRCIPNHILRPGVLYAYLSSKYGHSLLTQGTFGAVIQHIEPSFVRSLPIPSFPEIFQEMVDAIMQKSALLREEATSLQEQALHFLIDKSGLGDITPFEYDYYGPGLMSRGVSCFTINKKAISSTTINAFNLSERVRNLKARISETVETKSLIDCVDDKGLFSTGLFPRVEVKPGHGIELINQRDIFNNVVHGKFISKRNVKTSNLVEKDEIIIAGVGTLAESETFCRCVYANEYLKGKLISGEFIRMKAKHDVPSGYLYTWLSSKYGFRLMRNTQAGTKLCRPIPKLLEQIPVPILSSFDMNEIDTIAKIAQDNLAKAAFNELTAISLVESEIEKWNKQ